MAARPLTRSLVIVIASLALTAYGAAAKTDAKVRADLNRVLPELKFDGTGLGDVLEFVKDVSGAQIVVDWAALAKAGVKKDTPVTVSMKDVKLAEALTKILDKAAAKPGRVVYTIKGGAIHVAPK
jgi:hypothetical protein